VLSTLAVTNLNDSSTFTAGDGSLRGEIAAAQSGDTIQFDPSLTSGTITLSGSELLLSKSLSIVAPTTSTGAPGITIDGNSASRLFEIQGPASQVSVTLQNLTLQHGLAYGLGVSAEGGAILNQGTLTLSGVLVQNNTAQARGDSAAGGGIYSSGALTLTGGTEVQNNTVTGGQGNGGPGADSGRRDGSPRPAEPGGTGGNGLGGGLYVAGGTATLSGVTLSGNSAAGGQGGAGGSGVLSAYKFTLAGANGGTGGNGFGGGMYVAGGTVTLTGATLTGNTATGGQGGAGGWSPDAHKLGHTGSPGSGIGGGLYIDNTLASTLVSLDSFTKSHVTLNTASTNDANIHGQYKLN
jgi:hypothetical protein